MREFILELTRSDCEIEELKKTYPSYCSFVITCDKQHEKTLLGPDEWETGIIIRLFFGRKALKTSDNDSGDVSS